MRESLPALFDELQKIAETSESGTAGHVARHAMLGAAIAPVAAGVSNYIQRGHITPAGVPLKRWLPGVAAFGGLMGGPAGWLHRKIDQGGLDAR